MFHQTSGKAVLPLVMALGLASCGGGGDDDGGSVVEPGAYVQGIWRGDVILDGTQDLGLVVGMIAANGDANLVVFGGDSQLRGTIWSDSTQINTSFSSLSSFGVSGDLGSVFGFADGTVVPASTIVVNLKDRNNRTLKLDLQFDPIYQRAGSLTTLAGTWRYELGDFFRQWQIDSSGGLAGSDSNGCNYAGQVSVPDPAHNLYQMSYQITGCYSITVQVRGLAMLDDAAAANDTLNSAGTGDVGLLNAQSFVDVMTRQPPAAASSEGADQG
jgi:hypothetical protein